ncbi:hypothetical protein TNCV_4373981 [Trichonephila clavipes]|uniref:Uncharacterized protein n=1 Tax=Trichonephila clavipes TaxID=2585209 RepID=A0A8X6UY59_TRICX|nr:hypothetical protein TNCV_4373981 [Trichonephila clavipes]
MVIRVSHVPFAVGSLIRRHHGFSIRFRKAVCSICQISADILQEKSMVPWLRQRWLEEGNLTSLKNDGAPERRQHA